MDINAGLERLKALYPGDQETLGHFAARLCFLTQSQYNVWGALATTEAELPFIETTMSDIGAATGLRPDRATAVGAAAAAPGSAAAAPGSTAAAGVAAGCSTGSTGAGGAGAGLGPGSAAAAASASEGLDMERIVGLIAGMDARLGEMTQVLRQFAQPTIVVTPSDCPTDKRIQIEGLLKIEFDYCPDLFAPCCLGHLPALATCPGGFQWPDVTREDAEVNVTNALIYLAELAPEGVVVLPVQSVMWLQGDVIIGNTTIVLSSAKTDYIFVTQEAWAECQAKYGAKLQGRNLCVKSGTTASEALQSMLSSILGLYEAKTTTGMKNGGLPKVRVQALMQYLAINRMREWPVDDVVVLFGDLNTHYAVHAGRKDMGKAKRSLHVAGPALLPGVVEGSPAAADDSGLAKVTAAFLKALLRPRGNDTTLTRMEAAESSGGGGTGGSGGGGTGGSGEGAGGNHGGGAANFRSGGTAHSHGGGAASSKQEASGSGGAPTGGSKDAHSSAGAGDGCGEWSVSGADSSSDRGGFGGDEGLLEAALDGDEGLLEAAQENWDAQVFMSLLRHPQMYKPLGLSEPPTSFQPPTKEETLASFRPWED